MANRIHSTLFLVSNIKNTSDFYKKLGFKVKQKGNSARIIFGDYRLAFMEGEKDHETTNKAKNGYGIFIYFEVEDLDKFTKDLEARQLKLENEPISQPWGKKELKIHDPDGYRLIFFENL
ncbi:VOC family protein [Candidatus Dojkabacteria bacterium]|nr:VOC family protein [Candidatus Dojkabacteria bacterium]